MQIHVRIRSKALQKTNKNFIFTAVAAVLFLFFTGSLCTRPIVKFKKKHKIKYNGPTVILTAKGFRYQRAKQKLFRTKGYILKIYAREFAQGNLLYIEIKPRKEEEAFYKAPQIFFNEKKVPASSTSWGYRAFVGISPDETIGKHSLRIKADVTSLSSLSSMSSIYSGPYTHEETHFLWIKKTKFPVSHRKIYISDSQKEAAEGLSPKQKMNIRRFSLQKKHAFNRYTKKILIKNRLAHPRNKHFVTSPFWSTRYLARYRKKNGKVIQIRPRKRVHQGLDLRARKGDSVFAVADGKVVLSEKMHYEGNFVLIDHGLGIFSGYMHLSKRYVHEGNTIQAGQQIGEAGATGAASGSHLHLLLYVRQTPVDPLSLLALPVRP